MHRRGRRDLFSLTWEEGADIGQWVRPSPDLSAGTDLELLTESVVAQAPYCERVLPDAVRSLWDEPPVPNPPVRVWRDWVVVGVVLVSAVLEGALRGDVVWRPVAIALALGLVWTLLWRRTQPLAMVTIVFGTLIVLSVASLLSDTGSVGLNTSVFVLLLPYALVRWGSGHDVVLGLPIILAAYVLGIAADYTSVGDSFAAIVFALSPVVIGALVRLQSRYQANQREQVRLSEREELARELHDTVAHHVSAIAVRAQAGRVVAAADPEAAVGSLAIIEAEATRALREMRLMVGALRDGEAADLSPTRGVADVQRLAHGSGSSPPVTVELSGDLDDLRPLVGAAVYRLAQESITNALRHARQATRIDVRIHGDERRVLLTVTDDGEGNLAGRNWSGFGLVGMSERAALLGGTFDAGPGPDKGWVVSAELPKEGSLT